jgi:methionyl-tRNA synthetase
MYDNGDIYKGKYVGKYCKPCESFWTESQLVDGKCPDCGRDVVDAEEEAYFFRASKYADRIRSLLLDTDFLEPKSRVNEMINNFIDCEGGLPDLCVSRTSFSWGIPVDFDPGHVVYCGWTPCSTMSPPWATATTGMTIWSNSGPA